MGGGGNIDCEGRRNKNTKQSLISVKLKFCCGDFYNVCNRQGHNLVVPGCPETPLSTQTGRAHEKGGRDALTMPTNNLCINTELYNHDQCKNY